MSRGVRVESVRVAEMRVGRSVHSPICVAGWLAKSTIAVPPLALSVSRTGDYDYENDYD